jgi:hypothetical protein
VTRHRTSSRLTVWLFAALLLAKGAVPFFATAAAQLHGKGVADICPIYGIALPAAPAIDPHAGHHHHHHASHGDDAAAPHDGATHDGGDGPLRHDTRGGDHCVLTALATFASETAAATSAPTSSATTISRVVASHEVLPADASARWASLLGHGPPHRS